MFYHQVDQLRDRYEIQPGEIAIAGLDFFHQQVMALGIEVVAIEPGRPGFLEPLPELQVEHLVAQALRSLHFT